MKRTDPYAGPFPRKRHSHRCKGCEKRGQYNAVACYKSKCTGPQLTDECSWCREPNFRAYEVVDLYNGYTVSGQIATKGEAQTWLEQRAKDMGKSVHAYHVKGVK